MRIVYAFLMSCVFVLEVFAQDHVTLNASGENASGEGGSSSYSVGQVFVQRSENDSVYLMEGIQQPLEINTYVLFEAIGEIALVDIFPNPFIGEVYLKMTSLGIGSADCRIYDVRGNLHSEQKVFEGINTLNLSGYAQGEYLVEISLLERKIFIGKVIKH